MPAEANGGPECVETNGESVPVDGNSGSKERRLCRYQWRARARAGRYRRKQGVGKAGGELDGPIWSLLLLPSVCPTRRKSVWADANSRRNAVSLWVEDKTLTFANSYSVNSTSFLLS